MDQAKPITTAYLGNPSALKDHSMRDIEESLSAALSAITGQRLTVTMNNLRQLENINFLVPPKFAFDVQVESATEQVEAPF